MSESVVHLRFPAKPDYLLLARLALSGLARELPLGDEVLADLKLAVTEACGNVVRHAYPDSDGEVCVSYVVAEDSIVMIVEDQGAGIAPDESPEPKPVPLEGVLGEQGFRYVADQIDGGDWRVTFRRG